MKTVAFLLLLLPALCSADSFPNPSGYWDASAWAEAVHEFEPDAVIKSVNSGSGTPLMSATYTYFDHYGSGRSLTNPVSIADGSVSMALPSSSKGYGYGILSFSQPLLAFAAKVTVLPIEGDAPFSLAGLPVPGIGYAGPNPGNGSFDGFFGFLYGLPSSGFVLAGPGYGGANATLSVTISDILVAVAPTAVVATPEPTGWQLMAVGVLLTIFVVRRRRSDKAKHSA